MRRAVPVVIISSLLLLTFACGFSRAPREHAGANTSAAKRGKAAKPGNKGWPLRRESLYVPGEVLVKFAGGAGSGPVGALLDGLGARRRKLAYARVELLEVSRPVEEALAALRSSPLVEYAEPNYVRSASDFYPDDPQFSDQWNLHDPSGGAHINMPKAWDIEKGTSSVVVAVLDTGVAYRDGGGYSRGTDLRLTKFQQGYDFVNGDAFADDDHGHGTHVCGTVAESTNNAHMVAGIAFGCTVMPVKVLDRDGVGTDSQLIQGIEFAAGRGVEVINMSLGGPDPSRAIEDAVDYAFGKGAVLVAAAGNDGEPAVQYPAACANCVAVGAVTRSGKMASYSNYGGALDVVAPGGDGSGRIYQETYRVLKHPESGFKVVGMTGTSMASPHAAGVCALVKSLHPGWSPAEVRAALTSTCRDMGPPGWDEQFGWGLIDAYAALESEAPGTAAPAVSWFTPDHGGSGETVRLIISGASFKGRMKVALEREGEPAVGATDISVSGTTRLTCLVDLTGSQPGLWDIRVENDRMTWDLLQGVFMVDSSSARTWYLCEGTTDYGFEEYVLVQNPTPGQAVAKFYFMTAEGPLSPYTVAVPARSRVTVRVNDLIGPADVSTMVQADREIICERSMYWGDRLEGTDSIGVQAASFTWYLSEGATDYGFETFLLVQNPNSKDALVQVTYLTPEGRVEKQPFVVGAGSRKSINVADDIPSGEMSFEVVSDQRVVAERSMYWDGRRGGHASVGANSPSPGWFLAEGSTGWGYQEWVLLANPGGEDAMVELTCLTPEGPISRGPLKVEAGHRATVNVNEILPGEDVSVRVNADRAVLAERALYWNNGTGRAGHCSVGVPQPRNECVLAEGSTAWGFDTWLLIANPNDSAASVGIEYQTEKGPVVKNAFQLAAGSRVSIHVNEDVLLQYTSAYDFSDRSIIAERSMYWHDRGGGHVSQGLLR